jgi:hypothetical protein
LACCRACIAYDRASFGTHALRRDAVKRDPSIDVIVSAAVPRERAAISAGA